MFNEVATTILSQIGGGRALFMLGAKNAVADGNALIIKCKAPRGFANYFRIELNGLDLYDVTFGRVGRVNFKTTKELSNVYAEDLRELIEQNTGLYLSL